MANLFESTLSEICNLVTDGTHDTPKSVNSGFLLVKAKEIAGGRINFEGCEQISEADHKKVVSRSKPEFGDTLFAHIGASLGETAFVNSRREFSIKNIALFKPNPAIVDGRYLSYYVLSPDFQERIKLMRTGSAQPFLGLSQLRGFPVCIHQNVAEQRRIASILSAYDDLIENNTRRIAILEEMARRLYEEWFVRFRFPGHEGVQVIESELGLVPEGWEVTTLGQFAEVNARSVRRGAEPTEIHYVDISSVSTGSIDKKERMLFADAPGRARRIVRDGDVIWACVRPNRKSYSLVLNPEPNLLVSTGFAVLSPVAVPCSFLYQCVTTKDFVSHLVNHAKGATYPAVSAADFENAKVLRPTANLVADFDKLAEPMMRLVAALQLKNANLRTTRDLLLPKLISGELDVSMLPEPQVETA